MAKKAKGNRVQVILECTEHKASGMPLSLIHISMIRFIWAWLVASICRFKFNALLFCILLFSIMRALFLMTMLSAWSSPIFVFCFPELVKVIKS